MVCDEFRSEIARLVYGYLVKENLTELALKFLTGSQYLQNCLQIKSTGVSLETKTKLLDKDLDELLDEYLTIQNLVRNKINILPKISELYIEINSNCDSNLLKTLEVLLNFFIINDKENLEAQKNSNCSADSSGDVGDKNEADSNYVSENENREKNDADGHFDSNEAEEDHQCYDEPPCVENNDYNNQNDYDANVNDELPPGNSETHNKGDDNRTLSDQNNVYPEIQNDENINDNIPKNLGNNVSVAFHNDNQCLTEEAMEVDSVSQYVEQNQNEGNIKILRIETQGQGETQTLNLYPNSLSGNETGINENSPVVFVDSSVGNFRINQDPNQIIVIPIDSYEAAFEEATRDEENQEGILSNANLNCNQQRDLSYQVIADNPPAITSNTGLCNNPIVKNPIIDSNIITESDFLKTKEIIYDTCVASSTATIIPNEVTTTSTAVQQQIVLVPPTRERFRKILPKAKKAIKEYSPAVVFVPVIRKESDSAKTLQEEQPQPQPEPQPQPQPLVPPQPKPTRQLRQKGSNFKKKGGKASSKKTKNEVPKNLNMPNLSTMLLDESPEKSGESTIVILQETDKTEENKNKNTEEKENQEEKEPTKIETPLVLSTRNSKRLSLSTPRRRSHIRALEFETPEKTNDEKKKSQTSPKVKVDQVTVERKSVRNTLFKSPDPETVFKSPMCLKNGKKVSPRTDEAVETVEPLNEMSIPIATRSPKGAALSETWEKLTGVSCVLEKPEEENDGNGKKSWDSDLRCFIALNNEEVDNNEKKRVRKPEKAQKDNKKPGKKKLGGKKSKTPPAMGSSSKMSLTAKRNTYSISENVEKSPVRQLQDDLKLITPFKDPEPIRPMEETPFTKLLRENIGMDMDFSSIINTPSFPPTPSILITPDLDDVGANYYTPLKNDEKNKTVLTDCLLNDKTKKQETKEIHEKAMGELVSKAQEIIGLRPAEENTVKRPPSGKILSMVKVQMITQCDKKLCKYIPINESVSFENMDETNEKTLIEIGEEMATPDLKVELEEKRKRAMKKIKEVKENLSTRNKVTRNLRKRKRSGGDSGKSSEKKSKLDVSSDTTGEKLTESDESIKKETVMVHSTPYAERARPKFESPEKTTEKKKPDQKTADEILQELPSFQDDNTDRYPELGFKDRKKIHFIESFLSLEEISNYVDGFNEKNFGKLDLKPSFKKFFQVFHKWLKHVNVDRSELNALDKTREVLKNYLTQFEKINKGLKNKKCKKDSGSDGTNNRKSSLDIIFKSYGGNKSDDEEDWKRKENLVKKDEEIEDGVVSTLPLKKRKANVQPVEKKESRAQETPEDLSATASENVSQTQNFLQDIDVDRFLSQIHGQNNR